VLGLRGGDASEETMDHWLGRLTDPIYGVIDLFLDNPLAAAVLTSLAAVLVGVMVLTVR
jgi:hypothetical protein